MQLLGHRFPFWTERENSYPLIYHHLLAGYQVVVTLSHRIEILKLSVQEPEEEEEEPKKEEEE